MNGWLENIARGIKGLGWMIVPGGALFLGIEWLVSEWAPKRGTELIDWLKDAIGDDVNIDLSTVGLDWARINQLVPVTEALDLGAKFVAAALALVVIRFVMKVIPGIG